jgi:predicted HTH transcriptional regulator
LDLTDRKHVAKIIKACVALYNSNGGYLVIGVNNDGTLHADGVLTDWRSIFNAEVLQQTVANNVSPPFEIEVTHVRRDQNSSWSNFANLYTVGLQRS